MKISGINEVNAQAGWMKMNQAVDSYSKNMQNQIANAQKQLQDLSSNENLTLEEKMKKRQEIQKEISNLNQQLRQHQIEQRKEQQSKRTSMDDTLGGNQSKRTAKSGRKRSGLSQASMEAMISADSSMKQAQIQGGVAARMEGRAGVLKAEIKQDANGNTEAKEAELAEVEQKAANATASQINTIASANQAKEEAAKAEQSGIEDEADAKTRSKTEKADKNGQESDKVSESKTDNTGIETVIQTSETSIAAENTAANAAGAVLQTVSYTAIDIRL